MNEDELRTWLDTSVRDIKPRNRLDDLLAKQRPRRNRGRLVLGVAAALIAAVLIFAAGRQSRSSESVITINPPQTTTTVPTRSPGRIGKQITIVRSTLPAGTHFLDERPRQIGTGQTLVARYAKDNRTWSGDGPYLRIILDRGTGLGTTWQATDRGEPDYQINGHAAYLTSDTTTDPKLNPPPNKLANLKNAWLTLVWSTGPNEVIEIQAKGVTPAAMRDLAKSVVIAP